MNSFAVVLDANVLFPFRKRDILLSFAHAGFFRAHWTDQIESEWTRSLLELKPHLAASVAAQLAAMREHFPEALVSGYEPLIEALTLPDPDDRHVLAAAIRCGAQQIITENLADFPDYALAPFDVEASGADDFLMQTFQHYPVQALEVLERMRQRYQNPAFTEAEFILDLRAKGLPKLASMLKAP
jgi:PIN domain